MSDEHKEDIGVNVPIHRITAESKVGVWVKLDGTTPIEVATDFNVGAAIKEVERKRLKELADYESNKPTKTHIVIMRFWEGVKRVIRNRQVYFAIPLQRINTYHRGRHPGGDGVATVYLSVCLGSGSSIYRRVIIEDDMGSHFIRGGLSLAEALSQYYGHIEFAQPAHE